MFTGLIKEKGIIRNLKKTGDGLEMTISSSVVAGEANVDDSIAVNGVCLTVISRDEGSFTAQAVKETVLKTNLNLLKTGSEVNLEPALKVNDRLGGHIVQGHIDGTGEIIRLIRNTNGAEYFIRTDAQTAVYIVKKGSVCLDGISLTVADIDTNVFKVAVIPHTQSKTTAGEWKTGLKLNIETDILGRYIEKLLESGKNTLTMEKLNEMGY
ncbi:MAG TPA: riboflavin synthase [Clostridiales bacterium]|nr:riboflavin synthase [Clostridiales bacterium]